MTTPRMFAMFSKHVKRMKKTQSESMRVNNLSRACRQLSLRVASLFSQCTNASYIFPKWLFCDCPWAMTNSHRIQRFLRLSVPLFYAVGSWLSWGTCLAALVPYSEVVLQILRFILSQGFVAHVLSVASAARNIHSFSNCSGSVGSVWPVCDEAMTRQR